MKNVSLLFLCLFLAVGLKGQKISGIQYVKFCKKLGDVPKELNFKGRVYGKQRIKYLGEIHTDAEVYKVISSYLDLQNKGVSRLVFVSQKKEVFIYAVDLPQELPLRIENNVLVFDQGEMIFKEPLPWICSSVYGCVGQTFSGKK